MRPLIHELSDDHLRFISEQRIFFVEAAAEGSDVNVSPKGIELFKVIGNKRIVWINRSCRENETSVQIRQTSRMNIMFCAFDDSPTILRLYGTVTLVSTNDPAWDNLFALFKPEHGAGQICDFAINRVQTSCGVPVSYFSCTEDKEPLKDWCTKKGEEELKRYWKEKTKPVVQELTRGVSSTAPVKSLFLSNHLQTNNSTRFSGDFRPWSGHSANLPFS